MIKIIYKKLNRIRTKLLILLLVVALIPMLFLGYMAIKSVKETRLENIKELEGQLTSQLNDRLEKFVDDKIASYRINVADPNVTAIGPEQQKFILNGLLLNDPTLEEVSFISPAGKEESHAFRDSSKNATALKNLANDEGFKTAEEGRDYVSTIQFINGVPQLIIASPVVNQKGEIINILQTRTELSSLSDLIAASLLGQEGYSYVADKEGSIIAISGKLEKNLIGKQSANPLVVVATEETAAPAETIKSLKNEDAFSSAKMIKKLGWVVLTEWPVSDAMGIIGQILLNLQMVAIVLIFLAFILGLFAARALVRPIHHLKQGTDAISKGEFDIAIDIKTGDEFEDLGNAFNLMAIDLKKLSELQKEKQGRLENAFGQYVGGSMIEQILAGQEVKLGGERKYISVLFADIKNFTTISETLEPEVLIKYLNKYLTAMTDIIMKHGGVIDKYIGDAILAFWGAPIPMEDHAYRACLAAEEMMDKLKEIQKELEDQGLPEIDIRIGINTGGALVGNVGSEQRLSYTVIGDTINLAARLESLNKQYKTRCMISQATFMEIRNKAVVRQLDKVEVKGKTEGVKVFELIAVENKIDEKTKNMIARYEEALKFYMIRKWDSAIKIFADLLNDFPDDGPSFTIMARAQEYGRTPPHADWDGTFQATEK